jgi:nucleotide-binding universal stress UspA family protein
LIYIKTHDFQSFKLVLSITQKELTMYTRILVATDGSTLSKKAVADAIGLAATCGAELIALKVVPRYPQAYFEGSIPLNAKDVSRIEAQWAEAAQAAVDAVQKTATAKGIKAKALVVRSDIVSDAIIAAAKKQKADLVVMASHGRKGIKRLLLGSETQQVLTHCHVPVLVLR